MSRTFLYSDFTMSKNLQDFLDIQYAHGGLELNKYLFYC